MYSGYVDKPSTFMLIPTMLLAVCQTENITINAKHIAKLSRYFRIEPSLNLPLALEIKSNDAIPNITVVTLTKAICTIKIHLLSLFLHQQIVLIHLIRLAQFLFQELLLPP